MVSSKVAFGVLNEGSTIKLMSRTALGWEIVVEKCRSQAKMCLGIGNT